jgi:hypothetical protein
MGGMKPLLPTHSFTASRRTTLPIPWPVFLCQVTFPCSWCSNSLTHVIRLHENTASPLTKTNQFNIVFVKFKQHITTHFGAKYIIFATETSGK